MPGYLTTHVLDTATGRPAADLKITLRRAGGEVVKTVRAHDDRRADATGRPGSESLPLSPFGYTTYRGG